MRTPSNAPAPIWARLEPTYPNDFRSETQIGVKIVGPLLRSVSSTPWTSKGTIISFSLEDSAYVDVKILRLDGSLVILLRDNQYYPGPSTRSVRWDGYDRVGTRVPDGYYLGTVITKVGGEDWERANTLIRVSW